jgi:hypothetical protein
MLNDDDFGEGSGDEMEQANYRKMNDKISKDGFRIGKAKEEEVITQVGFDEGFMDGIRIGKAAGQLYAAVRLFASSSNPEFEGIEGIKGIEGIEGIGSGVDANARKLEKVLFESMPESTMQPVTFLTQIEQTVEAISPTLLVDFEAFKAAVELETASEGR